MNEISATVSGNTLTIVCDISPSALANARLSSTGKSKIVASTGGYQRISPTLSLSVNLITK
jgi:hypothetical protein